MPRRPPCSADLALLLVLLLAPAEHWRVGRGGDSDLGDIRPTSFTLVHAAHANAGQGNVGGFGGDSGTVPELEQTRTVGPDPATAIPAVITQFQEQQGVVAVGMVEELLLELNKAFCDQGLTRTYKCVEFEDARERLWMTFANDYVCGGLDAPKWRQPPRAVQPLPVQAQFAYLLAACETQWEGDLVAVVREATVLFLAQSTLNRVDIKATVVKNDRKAQRDDTLPTDDLYELHPGFYEDLTPASTGVREPAVATWKVEPDLDGHTPYAEGGMPRVAALNARNGILIAKSGATEQYPDLFNRDLDASATGKSLYGTAYRGHPSKLAKWNEAAFCQGAFDESGNVNSGFENFDACYPRLVPQIGVTHDAYGKRLLTNRGQSLPQGYDDPNVMGVDERVTGR